MLIEDYMHSLKNPFLALDMLNEAMENEMQESWKIFMNQEQGKNLYDKILAMICANKALIKILQNDRENIEKVVNNSYDKLLKDEI